MKTDAQLINAHGAAYKALVARKNQLLAEAEEVEEEGEMAQMDAEKKAEALKKRAGEIEMYLAEAMDD